MLKQELAEIFPSKKEVFYMKAIIWKSKKKIRYAFSDFYIKTDQRSNLVIINLKLVKRLKHRVKPTNTITNYCLNMSIVNSESTKLKS